MGRRKNEKQKGIYIPVTGKIPFEPGIAPSDYSEFVGEVRTEIKNIKDTINGGEYNHPSWIRRYWLALLALIAALLPEHYKVALWKWFWNVLDAASTMPQ